MGIWCNHFLVIGSCQVLGFCLGNAKGGVVTVLAILNQDKYVRVVFESFWVWARVVSLDRYSIPCSKIDESFGSSWCAISCSGAQRFCIEGKLPHFEIPPVHEMIKLAQRLHVFHLRFMNRINLIVKTLKTVKLKVDPMLSMY